MMQALLCKSKAQLGFTLAELLVSLLILGVIATFTIPKILQAQQNKQNLAEAKEVAAMIASAYQQAQLAGQVTSSTKSSDLISYMNYVSLDTVSIIDSTPAVSSTTCSSTDPCLKLHNGGMLWLHGGGNFGGTGTLNVIEFRFDPDPLNNTTSTADGPLKAVQFDLYYNGFLTTRALAKSGSMDSGGPIGSCTGCDPSWFSW